MKRPSFQFYPADWRNNAKLRRCSEAARGAWIDVLCLMHDSDEYGVLRWPLADIARATGLPLKLLKELAERGVLKGGDNGCKAFYHIPVHARKQGDPVLLLDETSESCWYSSRFLVDEWRRSVKGSNTRFGASDDTPNDSPSRGKVNGKVKEDGSPNKAPSARLGDGSTSSPTDIPVVNNTELDISLLSQPVMSVSLTPGDVCRELVAIGMMCNPGHQKLVELISSGATLEEFVGAARDAKSKGKFNFEYMMGIVANRRIEAKKLDLHQGPLPASNSKEAGRQIAASSIFKPEHTKHLQSEKTIEGSYVQIK